MPRLSVAPSSQRPDPSLFSDGDRGGGFFRARRSLPVPRAFRALSGDSEEYLGRSEEVRVRDCVLRDMSREGERRGRWVGDRDGDGLRGGERNRLCERDLERVDARRIGLGCPEVGSGLSCGGSLAAVEGALREGSDVGELR